MKRRGSAKEEKEERCGICVKNVGDRDLVFSASYVKNGGMVGVQKFLINFTTGPNFTARN